MSIFVSYRWFDSSASGSGRCEVSVSAPKNMDDIEYIESEIRKNPMHVNHKDRVCLIMSWQEWGSENPWEKSIKDWTNSGYELDTSSPEAFIKELEEWIEKNIDGG